MERGIARLKKELINLVKETVKYIAKDHGVVDDNNQVLTIKIKNVIVAKNVDIDDPAEMKSLLEKLAILIHEVDIIKAQLFVKNLTEAFQKADNAGKKQIVVEIRKKMGSALPVLSNARHNMKSTLKYLFGSLKVPTAPTFKFTPIKKDAPIAQLAKKRIQLDNNIFYKFEKYENAIEAMAETFHKLIHTFNYFISPKQTETCINHCFEVIEVLTITYLINNDELTKKIYKFYKNKLDMDSDKNVREFVDTYC